MLTGLFIILISKTSICYYKIIFSESKPMGNLCIKNRVSDNNIGNYEDIISKNSILRSGEILNTADDVTDEMIKLQITLIGKVVNVADGDTIRILHSLEGTPDGIKYAMTPEDHKTIAPLRKTTIKIRIYGIDAPETSKFGKEGQPFSEEATEYIKELLYEKYIYVKLLDRDQYGRIISRIVYVDSKTKKRGIFSGLLCHPPTNTIIPHDPAEELLKMGYACLYRGRGAQYDGKTQKDVLEKLENDAKNNEVGMWSIDESNRELPSQYKNRQH